MNIGLRLVAKIVLLFCIIGITLIAYVEIALIGSDGSALHVFPHRGYLFALLIFMALWAMLILTRSAHVDKQTPFIKGIKILAASYALGGAIFIILSIGALMIFGPNGLETLFINMLAIVSVCMVLSLPIIMNRIR